MSLLAITLLTAFVQAPVDPGQGTPDPAGQPVGGPVSLQQPIQLPGIEAPTQPTSRSTARVTRGVRTGGNVSYADSSAVRVRINELVAVRGQEDNVVQGIGLVVGLAGTGDTTDVAKLAIRNFMMTQNITVSRQDVASANVAVVTVEATLTPSIKPGRRVDLRVSSLNDAKSLIGGVLLQAELTDMQGQRVYVTGSGPLSTGAFLAEGEGASAKRNHPTIGVVPRGGKVEREVKTEIVSEHGYLHLDLRSNQGSFGNVTRIAEAINQVFPQAAIPVDGMTVRVRVPADLPEGAHIGYLHSLLTREIEPEALARVVINERTGVIVMGEGVRISRGAITKGNLTVSVAETPEISQPGPLSNGETRNIPRTDLLVEEENRALTLINGAVTLREVVEVLNVLGVTPRDMIDMLQSMAQAGMLHAEIVAL